jgi:hypothetical protein
MPPKTAESKQRARVFFIRVPPAWPSRVRKEILYKQAPFDEPSAAKVTRGGEEKRRRGEEEPR